MSTLTESASEVLADRSQSEFDEPQRIETSLEPPEASTLDGQLVTDSFNAPSSGTIAFERVTRSPLEEEQPVPESDVFQPNLSVASIGKCACVRISHSVGRKILRLNLAKL